MKRRSWMAALLALAMLVSLTAPALAVGVGYTDGKLTLTREEGDPALLYAARYDEAGRMIEAHFVKDSLTLEGKAKFFQLAEDGTPAAAAMTIAAEPVVYTVSPEENSTVSNLIFATPVTVAGEGSILFENCLFAAGLTATRPAEGALEVSLAACPEAALAADGAGEGEVRFFADAPFTLEGLSIDPTGCVADGAWVAVTETAASALRVETAECHGEFGFLRDIRPALVAAESYAGELEISGYVDVSALSLAEGGSLRQAGGARRSVLTLGGNTLFAEGYAGDEVFYYAEGGGVVFSDPDRFTRYSLNDVSIGNLWLSRFPNGQEDYGYAINLWEMAEGFTPALYDGAALLENLELRQEGDNTSFFGDALGEGTALVLTLPNGAFLRFEGLARDWERPVPLQEFARWLCERLEQSGHTFGEENLEALSAQWPEYDWERWGDAMSRRSLSYALAALGAAAENFPSPDDNMSYGGALLMVNALLQAQGAAAALAPEPGWTEEAILNLEEANRLADEFQNLLPLIETSDPVSILAGDGDRYSLDGGETWENQPIRGRRFTGPVTVTCAGENDSWPNLFSHCDFAGGLTVITNEAVHLNLNFDGSCTGSVTVRRLAEENGDYYSGVTSLNGADGLTITARCALNVNSNGAGFTLNGVSFAMPEEFHTGVSQWWEENWRWDEERQENVQDGASLVMNLNGWDYWKNEETGEESESAQNPITLTGTLTMPLRLSGVVDATGLTVVDAGLLRASGDDGSLLRLGANDLILEGNIGGYAGRQYVETSGTVYDWNGSYADLRLNGAALWVSIYEDSDWIWMNVGQVALSDITLYPHGGAEPLDWNALPAEAWRYEANEDGFANLGFRRELVDGDSGSIRLEVVSGASTLVVAPVPFSWNETMSLNRFADAFLWEYLGGEYDDTWRDYTPSVEGMRLDPRSFNFLLDYAGLAESRVEENHWNFGNPWRDTIRYGEVVTAFETLYRSLTGDPAATLPAPVRMHHEDDSEWDEENPVWLWTYDQMREAFSAYLPREEVSGEVLFLIGRTEGTEDAPENEYMIAYLDGELVQEAGEWNHNVEGALFTGSVTVRSDGNPDGDYAGMLHFRNCTFANGLTIEGSETHSYNVALLPGCRFENGSGVTFTGSTGEKRVGLLNQAENGMVSLFEEDFSGTAAVCGAVDVSAMRPETALWQWYDENIPERQASRILLGANTIRLDGNVRGRQEYTAAGGEVVVTDANIWVEPIVNGVRLTAKAKQAGETVWFDYYLDDPTLVEGVSAALDGEPIALTVDEVDENGWVAVWGDFEDIYNTAVSFRFENATLTFDPIPREWDYTESLHDYLWELWNLSQDVGNPLPLDGEDTALLASLWNREEVWGGEMDRQLLTWAAQNAESVTGYNYDDPYANLRHDTAIQLASALWTLVKGESPLPVSLFEEGLTGENADWQMSRGDIEGFLWNDLRTALTAVSTLEELVQALAAGGEVTLGESMKVYPEALEALGCAPELRVLPDSRLRIPSGTELFIGEGVTLVLAEGAYPDEDGEGLLRTAGGYWLRMDENGNFYADTRFAELMVEGRLLVSGSLTLEGLSQLHNGGEVEINGSLTLNEAEKRLSGYMNYNEAEDSFWFEERDWDDERGDEGWVWLDTGAQLHNGGSLLLNGSATVGGGSGIHNNAWFNWEDEEEHATLHVSMSGTLTVAGWLNNNTDSRPDEAFYRFSRAEVQVEGQLLLTGEVHNAGRFEVSPGGLLRVEQEAVFHNNAWADEYGAGIGTLLIREEGSATVDTADLLNGGQFSEELNRGVRGEMVVEGALTLTGGTEPDESGYYRITSLLNEGELTITGSLTCESGSLINAGLLHLAAGGTLCLTGDGNRHGELELDTLNGGLFTREGTLLTESGGFVLVHLPENEAGSFSTVDYAVPGAEVRYALYVTSPQGFSAANGAYGLPLQESLTPEAGEYHFDILYIPPETTLTLPANVSISCDILRNFGAVSLEGGTITYETLYGAPPVSE